mgnify:CR=1 FL=1
MSEQNKWALLSGAKEQIGGNQNGGNRAKSGSVHLFLSFYRVDDFTQHIKK